MAVLLLRLILAEIGIISIGMLGNVTATWTMRCNFTSTPYGRLYVEFSVPQIEYPLGGTSKKGSHVYFLLQVLLLFDINV